ncbi:MAG: diadenosine tetraphosphatase, partial [Proteobacteria bacterium]|nr:diadenosine tetraphosphatase [Pseudomonadota bacterium]
MATWAVGDVQGCLRSLEALLEKIKFDRQQDYLWLAGDLIGRGPDPAGLIDFLISFGNRVVCVLGNHDINLLAINEGLKAPRPDDNLESLLDHPKKSV